MKGYEPVGKRGEGRREWRTREREREEGKGEARRRGVKEGKLVDVCCHWCYSKKQNFQFTNLTFKALL